MCEVKVALSKIIDQLNVCEDIEDLAERRSEYTKLTGELTKVYNENRNNVDPEIAELIALAFAAQKAAKGLCSVGKAEVPNGFISAETPISDIKDYGLRNSFAKARAKINNMGSDSKSQKAARLAMFNAGIKSTPNKDGDGFIKSWNKTVMVSRKHPELDLLWDMYYNKVLELDLQLKKELETVESPTQEAVTRLEILTKQVIPNVLSQIEKRKDKLQKLAS